MFEDFDWNRALDSGLGFFRRNDQPQPKPAAPAPAKDNSWIKWAVVAGIAVVVLGLGAFLLRGGKSN